MKSNIKLSYINRERDKCFIKDQNVNYFCVENILTFQLAQRRKKYQPSGDVFAALGMNSQMRCNLLMFKR